MVEPGGPESVEHLRISFSEANVTCGRRGLGFCTAASYIDFFTTQVVYPTVFKLDFVAG